jgi:hypothetical protein
MNRFYLYLWFFWLVRVFFLTLFLAAFLAALITFFLYIKGGMAVVDDAVMQALFAIWYFWFGIFTNLTLLFALFWSVKHLFNNCYANYMLKLKQCEAFKQENVYKENILYRDLIKVWRKWLMLLIWLVGAELIFIFVFNALVSSAPMFSWFSIYTLYLLIAIGAYFSFVLLASRCHCVKVVRC